MALSRRSGAAGLRPSLLQLEQPREAALAPERPDERHRHLPSRRAACAPRARTSSLVTASMNSTIWSGVRMTRLSISCPPSQPDTLRVSSMRSNRRPFDSSFALCSSSSLMPRSPHPRQLVDQRLRGLDRLLRVDAGVHGERARVQVVAGEAVDVVAERALLAQLHEQPAAHPLAEDHADQVEREAVRVLVRQRVHRDLDVRLLGPLVHDGDARRILPVERPGTSSMACPAPSRRAAPP